jgi:hypothetical protein
MTIIMANTIHHHVNQFNSNNKGAGLIVIENIPKNTIIIKEKPGAFISYENKSESSHNDMYRMIYKIFYQSPNETVLKFLKLTPHILDLYCLPYAFYKSEIVTIQNKKIRNTLLSIESKDLRLYCAKYCRNAFRFLNGSALLFNGTLNNHSCYPNVSFKESDGYMIFKTIRDIRKGEELYISYINTTNMNTKERQNHLLKNYGFICECIKCKMR